MEILKTREEGRQISGAGAFRLLVLIPHRDARLPLRSYSGALFSAGFYGAWSFPWVAPLALLSRPFTAGELKHCACALRGQSLAGGRDGKIKTGPAARAVFPLSCTGKERGEAAVLGPTLDIVLPDAAFTAEAAVKIRYRFSPLVLGAALTWSSGSAPPETPVLSFRAAALANMIYRPLPDAEAGVSSDDSLRDAGPQDAAFEGAYSFEWKIGKSIWLPSIRKKG
jgi:hypothetical protein